MCNVNTFPMPMCACTGMHTNPHSHTHTFHSGLVFIPIFSSFPYIYFRSIVLLVFSYCLLLHTTTATEPSPFIPFAILIFLSLRVCVFANILVVRCCFCLYFLSLDRIYNINPFYSFFLSLSTLSPSLFLSIFTFLRLMYTTDSTIHNTHIHKYTQN